MLGQRGTTVGGEQVSEKLDLGHSKFTLGEANGQPMLMTEEENFTEMVYAGGEILAEDYIRYRCGDQKACAETQTFRRE